MRIINVKSVGLLAEGARTRLENMFYRDIGGAVADVKACFPNHVVSNLDGCIHVTNRDGLITVAVFKGDTEGLME